MGLPRASAGPVGFWTEIWRESLSMIVPSVPPSRVGPL